MWFSFEEVLWHVTERIDPSATTNDFPAPATSLLLERKSNIERERIMATLNPCSIHKEEQRSIEGK